MTKEEFNRRAITETLFLMKYLIIGIFCFAFFLWSTYDAFIKYPGKVERAKAWQVLVDDATLDDAQRHTKWKEVASENGWNTKRPKKDESVSSLKTTVIWNYFFMAIGLAVAVPNIIWVLRVRGSWIECDQTTLRHSDGTELEIDSITKIDKKKWEKKGIAVVHYQSQGEDETFVIDDLKYEREPADEIMEFLESKLSPEQIVNGPTEADIREEKKRKQAEAEAKEATSLPTERIDQDTLVDDE